MRTQRRVQLPPVRVVLDEEEFRALVTKAVVRPKNLSPGSPPVEITLSDIGWNRIFSAVALSMSEAFGIADIEVRIVDPEVEGARPDGNGKSEG